MASDLLGPFEAGRQPEPPNGMDDGSFEQTLYDHYLLPLTFIDLPADNFLGGCRYKLQKTLYL